MLIKRTFFLSLFIALTFMAACSQPLSSHENMDPQERLDYYCQKKHRVALGFLYRTPGQTLSAVSGYSDINSRELNASENIYEIGSTTKSFIAVVIMQLVEEGHITLRDTVDSWGYDFENSENICIGDLLNHTSGIEDFLKNMTIYEEENGYLKNRTPNELIELGISLPHTEGWSYSNTNYIILGKIIESITGNTAEQEIRERILNPLGMNHTYYRPTENVSGTINHGYYYDKGYWDSWTNVNPDLYGYAGAMVSTMEDLALFIEALFNEELLGKESLEAMCVMTETPNPFNYGLGLLCMSFGGKNFYGHGGTSFGTRSLMVHCPETGETYVFYSTLYNDDFYPVLEDIYEILQ